MNFLRKMLGGKADDKHEEPTPLPSPEASSSPLAELEEQSEPLSGNAPSPLKAGDRLLAPDGRELQIVAVHQPQGATNVYTAHWPIATKTQETTAVRLREAEGTPARALEREAQARRVPASGAAVSLPFFFTSGEKDYLVDETPQDAPSLATLFQQNAPLEATLPVLLGAAQAVARLHAGGWVHGKLCPEVIGTSGTGSLLDFSSVRRQGEVWDAPFFQGEYSAPELAQEGVVAQPNTDVYTLGVLFYQALAGAPIETVQNDVALQQRVFAMAGVPQILTRALAMPESRFQSAGELHEALARWASRRTPPPQYSIAVASTIGLNPSRTANEDAGLHLSGGWHGEDGQTRWALLAVADGMGGMDAGEVASQAAVRSLAQSASPLATLDRVPEEGIQAQWTKQWAQQAAVAVSSAMAAENARGGCTLIAALAIGSRITLAHAGDCRAYVFSAATGAWRVLTHDHSYVATLWQAGEIAWEELRTHPNRNQITRALGEKAPPPEWFFDSLETATGKVSHSLASREVLLLCSDGVWEPVLEEEMARLLQESYPDLGATAQAILGLALERGAPDNATVALLAVSGGEEGQETC